MVKRICIIGGSGFVGRAITRAARNAGYDIAVGCRHPERARDMLVKGVALHRVDIASGRGLEVVVAGADCVINLVGLLYEKGSQTFEAVHVHGTEHVLAACKAADVRRYLHMSTLGADADSPSAYARTKAEAEAVVKASGFTWTIFRPSVIFGAGDSFFNKFKRMTDVMPVLPVIAGDTRFQPVWVEDVARAFVVSIDNRHVRRKTFELGGPEVFTFRELLVRMLEALGRRRLLLPVPLPVARVMAACMQFLPVPPLTPDQLVLLGRDNVVDGPAFPSMFGKPSAVGAVLPTYIGGGQADMLQHRLDENRRQYWGRTRLS